MPTNPYESPAAVGTSRRRVDGHWRALAVALWLLGVLPIASAVAHLLTRGLPAEFARNDPGVWIGVVSGLLPLIAFGLLGWAAWQRSPRLATAGLIVVGVFAVTVLVAFLYGLVP